MRAIADRKEQLALFERLLAGNLGARILLVEGTGERGKSTLLGEFARFARAKWGSNACAALELKQGVPLRQVFQSIYQGLGEAACARYAKLRRERTGPAITVTADLANAKVGNANQISVGSNITVHEADPTGRFAEAIHEDLLDHPGPVLIILDTYNEATRECTKWLLDVFLPVVARNEGVFCVIGGRSIPDKNEYRLSWGELTHVQTLATEISLDDWYEYACDHFPGFPRDLLATVYRGLKDRPGSIRTYIHNVGPDFGRPANLVSA